MVPACHLLHLFRCSRHSAGQQPWPQRRIPALPTAANASQGLRLQS
jgi:hypothetical protein